MEIKVCKIITPKIVTNLADDPGDIEWLGDIPIEKVQNHKCHLDNGDRTACGINKRVQGRLVLSGTATPTADFVFDRGGWCARCFKHGL